MATVSITIYEAGIRALLGPDGEVGRYLELQAQRVADEARADAPVQTGRLRSSIVTEVAGDARRVVADVPYALAVHEGARPHVITPRQASVLRFPSKAGAIVYTNRVNHPGNKANPFLLRAMQRVFGG